MPAHLDRLLATPLCARAVLADDEATLLTAWDASGVFDLLEVPVGGGPARPRPTPGADAAFPLAVLPGTAAVLFEQDSGGDERAHLRLAEDGEVRDLTPWEGVRCVPYGFWRGRAGYLFGANRDDPTRTDVWELDLESLEPRRVWEDSLGGELAAWSRCGRYLALHKPRSTLDADVWLVDLQGGEPRNLTAHEGDVYHSAFAFEPDGAALWLESDAGQDFKQLVRLDLSDGSRQVYPGPGGDVLGYWISEDGAWRARLDDHEACMTLAVGRGDALEAVDLPPGQVTGFTFGRGGTRAAFLLEDSTHPPTPWVLELASGETRPLLDLPPEAAAPETLAPTHHLWFPSWDELEVPGVLYQPRGEACGSGVVWVHGGPGGQSRRRFDTLLQAMAGAGHAVFAVNNRGSSGYGKRFFDLDRRGHGNTDLDDCVAAKQVLVQEAGVDPTRIAIAGGSYGGYMTLAALAFRPGSFRCGVDVFGVSNWLRTLKEFPPWWTSLRDVLYDKVGHPVEDEEYLRAISPLFHAEAITEPLMVLQGANDPRVLQAESDEIVAALEARGVPVEYLVFEDEGHGFKKVENLRRGYAAVLEFLGRYL